LALSVSKTGARSWILRARVGDRRRDIGLGSFSDVALKEAREKAREYRQRVREGIDPVEQRKAARVELIAAQAALAAKITFDEAAKRCIAAKRSQWSNLKHAAQWENTLASYASPYIGKFYVDQIESAHVAEALMAIWETKPETATRVRMRIEAVLAWATVHKFRKGDNPASWRGNLQHTMPSPKRMVRHMAAMPYAGISKFLPKLREQAGIAARAVEFAILTAARSGEVRGAVWSEIDLVRKIWTVPAERMKSKKEHRVPLSAQAIKLLKQLPRARSGFVFAAPKGDAFSDMALTEVLRRMEQPYTVHGFRSSFADWCGDKTEYPSEIAEAALAHAVSDKVVKAYRRTSFFDKRREVLRDWALYCETGKMMKRKQK
jgi:integrase